MPPAASNTRKLPRSGRLRGLLREPLLHFMLVGAALFLTFEWARKGDAARDDEIRVDQPALVQFLSYRNPRLNVDSAADAFETMTSAQREALIEEYVREEVLFRQARAIGLDPYDYIGRRRLITQLDYINRGFIEATLEFSEDEVRAFHEANAERYFVPPRITFTHAYFSSDSRGENAEALARLKLAELNENEVPFHAGPSHGDVFLYHKNYVAREVEEIASHFGAAFASEVFAQQPSERWIGPFSSEYGHHIVMVSAREPGRSPPMAEVHQRVIQDLMFERMREELDRYYQEARAAYDVVVDLPETAP